MDGNEPSRRERNSEAVGGFRGTTFDDVALSNVTALRFRRRCFIALDGFQLDYAVNPLLGATDLADFFGQRFADFLQALICESLKLAERRVLYPFKNGIVIGFGHVFLLPRVVFSLAGTETASETTEKNDNHDK